MLQSPFEQKNQMAEWVDALALRLLLLLLSVGYFLLLWQRILPGLAAGTALFLLVLLTILLAQHKTQDTRKRLQRERITGEIAIEELLLMPGSLACEKVCDLLCALLGAQKLDSTTIRAGNETLHIRLAQIIPGSVCGAGEILAVHRACGESTAERCILACTGEFSAEAVRFAQWVSPPVTLLPAKRLAAFFGKLHPATDEEIGQYMRRHRQPFTRSRIKELAFSPQKTRRYMLCAFLLLLVYLVFDLLSALLSCLLAFALGIVCYNENRNTFKV